MSRRWTFFFLALFCLPLLIGLDSSSIWNANEAFYVQTPREMIERGDWVVPYFNDRPRLNKPPLAYWVVGTFYQLFGVSVFSQRLAMALVACLAPLLVYGLGRELGQGSIALVSAGAFATTFRFLILSRRLMIDVLLLVAVLSAIYAFLLWERRQKPRYLNLMALALGLGFLAKGPVALLPAMIGFGYLVITAQWRRLRAIPWLSAAAIFLLVISPWFVALGLRAGWSSVSDFFFLENIGRFASVAFGPGRGGFYYVTVFLADFFPWSFVFLGVIFAQLRTLSRPDPNQLFLLVWIIGWIGFFSLSLNKQEYYILPAYPAAALLIGDAVRKGADRLWATRLAAIGFLLIAALLTWFSLQLFPPDWTLWLPLLPAFCFVGFLWRRNWLVAPAFLSIFFALCFVAFLGPLEEYRPVRYFATEIERLAPDRQGISVGYYQFTAPSLAYYLGPPVAELYAFEDVYRVFLSSRRTLLVTNCSDVETLETAIGIPLHVLAQRPRISTRLSIWLRSPVEELGSRSALTRLTCLISDKASF